MQMICLWKGFGNLHSSATGIDEQGATRVHCHAIFTSQKEIVMYAYFKRLDYFSTECVYAPFAARGFARDFVKDLEVCVSTLSNSVVCVCEYCSSAGDTSLST